MGKLNNLQDRVTELLVVAGTIQDRQNTSVFISLEDFHDKKCYLYCRKEIWQRFLNLKSEGRRFIELSKNEYFTIGQKQIEL